MISNGSFECPHRQREFQHTVSRRPESMRSVVVWIFPPLRCKSQRMLRLSACGNICCILSTAISRDRRKASGDRAGRGGEGPAKNIYLITRPEMTRMASRYGSEIWSSDMVV